MEEAEGFAVFQKQRLRVKMMDKKAVSEMIAYVLLIVIAISVSVIVYAVLVKYFPKEPEKCPDDVSLIIESYSCDIPNHIFTLTVRNQGLHSVDGMYVHIGNQSGKPAVFPLGNTEYGDGEIAFPGKLNASKSISFNLDYSNYNDIKKISVKPFRIGKTVVFCDLITTQDINCNPVVTPVTPACTRENNCTDWVNKNVRDNCLANEENWTLPCEPDECNSLEQSRCTEVESVPIVYTDPVSWWKFDESIGAPTCADSGTPGGNSLVTIGSPSFILGKVGNALSVTGSGRWTENGTTITKLQLIGDMTLEALINVYNWTSGAFGEGYVVGDVNGTNFPNYGLKINATYNNTQVYYAGNLVVSSSLNSISLDTWYHLVAVKDGSVFRLYINNVNVGNGVVSGTPAYTQNRLVVGWIGKGLTDEVAIYNQSLTDAEISKHYDNAFSNPGVSYNTP